MELSLPKLKREHARPAALIAALALVVAATVVGGREKPALEPAEAAGAARPARPAPAAELDLTRLERAQAAAPRNDPFAPRSFAEAPARPRPARARAQPAAPEPGAPQLPFTFFGRLVENGRTEVFVMRGEELISVAAGQQIDGEYRVDAVNRASIAFTYLPLKARQTLELPEAGE
jgi:hypothetical protein